MEIRFPFWKKQGRLIFAMWGRKNPRQVNGKTEGRLWKPRLPVLCSTACLASTHGAACHQVLPTPVDREGWGLRGMVVQVEKLGLDCKFLVDKGYEYKSW